MGAADAAGESDGPARLTKPPRSTDNNAPRDRMSQAAATSVFGVRVLSDTAGRTIQDGNHTGVTVTVSVAAAAADDGSRAGEILMSS